MSLRHSIRRFATAAAPAAEPSQYLLNVSRAQGVVKGLTGGTSLPLWPPEPDCPLTPHPQPSATPP